MSPLLRATSLINHLFFMVRSRIRWERPVPPDSPVPERERLLQEEVRAFLDGFAWKDHLTHVGARRRLVVADIGARNFAMAPAFDAHFRKLGFKTELHGIEMDAYRWIQDFRTRADYGKFFAARTRCGFYHPIDFFHWHGALDVAFFLKPSLSAKSARVLLHAQKLLATRGGVLVVGCPLKRELERVLDLARGSGFTLRERAEWHPTEGSVQKRPRLGAVLSA